MEILIFLIVWGGFAYAVGKYTKTRGREIGLWMGISALISPLIAFCYPWKECFYML